MRNRRGNSRNSVRLLFSGLQNKNKGDQYWVFFGRNDGKAESPVLWPPHAKS